MSDAEACRRIAAVPVNANATAAAAAAPVVAPCVQPGSAGASSPAALGGAADGGCAAHAGPAGMGSVERAGRPRPAADLARPAPACLDRLWRGRERVPGTLSGAAVLCLVFLPFALGHALSSLLRTVNAIVAPQMMASVALTPAQLGFLTSAYFLAFALFQLPVGVLLDRQGPRRVQCMLLLVAAAGTLAFAWGQSFAQLLCARALMGFGLAGCFMAAVKALSTWIAPARLPSVQGYLIAAGGLGAAAATLPVRLALQFTDWRGLFVWLAAACAVTALGILLLAPTPPAAAPKPFSWKVLADVYRHPVFRKTASLVLIPHTVFFGIQGLWVARWLRDAGHYPEQAVAWLLYLAMAALIFGAIAVGMLTEWAARRGIAPLNVAAAGIALFLLVQFGFVCNWQGGYSQLAVLFTLAGTITGIEYAIVAQAMPPALTGRAATCLNLLIFLGAFAVQAGFGRIVACWPLDAQGRYPVVAYQAAFCVLLLLQLPGLLLFLLRTRRARRALAIQ
ncbi:MFS transporter [Massilia sp. MB5]|uniref:MFS transporter n=1 Tax=Massilia sp. MB5 TaxID=2919578 RepID=UPI001F1123C9|nr:MFS transporter [Massilia sp. MB5]UMR31233.1 MFS transporter [Massilia sp. MB5]